MKTMTCGQLGSACDTKYHVASFDEIAGMSKQHAMEMFQKKDAAHLEAMHEMQELMKKPDAMKEWFEGKKEGICGITRGIRTDGNATSQQHKYGRHNRL